MATLYIFHRESFQKMLIILTIILISDLHLQGGNLQILAMYFIYCWRLNSIHAIQYYNHCYNNNR